MQSRNKLSEIYAKSIILVGILDEGGLFKGSEK